MSDEFVKGFLVFMVIVLTVFIGWAVMHHYDDEHRPDGKHFDRHPADCRCDKCLKLRYPPRNVRKLLQFAPPNHVMKDGQMIRIRI